MIPFRSCTRLFFSDFLPPCPAFFDFVSKHRVTTPPAQKKKKKGFSSSLFPLPPSLSRRRTTWPLWAEERFYSCLLSLLIRTNPAASVKSPTPSVPRLLPKHCRPSSPCGRDSLLNAFLIPAVYLRLAALPSSTTDSTQRFFAKDWSYFLSLFAFSSSTPMRDFSFPLSPLKPFVGYQPPTSFPPHNVVLDSLVPVLHYCPFLAPAAEEILFFPFFMTV